MCGGSSVGANQPASTISEASTAISPPAHFAVKPIIREPENGQGWLPKYRISVTSNPGLLLDLARNRGFQRLANFDEAGQNTEERARETRIARE